MESRLACSLVLALAMLIGFAFVGFGEARASGFTPGDFQSKTFSTVACCDSNFNTTGLKNFEFTEANQSKFGLKEFAFTNREFQADATRTFTGNFAQYLDLSRGSFKDSGFKADFAANFQKSVGFNAQFRAVASFNGRAFQRGDFFESIAFAPSNLRDKDFPVNFEDGTFDHDFASAGSFASVGFSGRNFGSLDGQFQV